MWLQSIELEIVIGVITALGFICAAWLCHILKESNDELMRMALALERSLAQQEAVEEAVPIAMVASPLEPALISLAPTPLALPAAEALAERAIPLDQPTPETVRRRA